MELKFINIMNEFENRMKKSNIVYAEISLDNGKSYLINYDINNEKICFEVDLEEEKFFQQTKVFLGAIPLDKEDDFLKLFNTFNGKYRNIKFILTEHKEILIESSYVANLEVFDMDTFIINFVNFVNFLANYDCIKEIMKLKWS